jgi:hypothetical protein
LVSVYIYWQCHRLNNWTEQIMVHLLNSIRSSAGFMDDITVCSCWIFTIPKKTSLISIQLTSTKPRQYVVCWFVQNSNCFSFDMFDCDYSQKS